MGLKHFWNMQQLVRSAPENDRQRIAGVLDLYRQVDQQTARFQRDTGLRCLAGCGQCCENPQIEATVLEVLPLAVELWRKGLAEQWLAKLAVTPFPKTCVFLSPAPAAAAPGRCHVYHQRPLICRMFGFAAVVDKHGKNVLVTCAALKDRRRDAYQRATQKIDQGLAVPRMADFFRKLQAVDLDLSQERRGINHAVKEALERVGLSRDYQRCQKANSILRIFSSKGWPE